MATGMDIRNIRMGIATVCLIVAQAVTVVWIVSKAAAKIETTSNDVASIKDDLKRDAADRRIWQQKIEADLSDLKVRSAILEAKVKDLELKSFAR